MVFINLQRNQLGELKYNDEIKFRIENVLDRNEKNVKMLNIFFGNLQIQYYCKSL